MPSAPLLLLESRGMVVVFEGICFGFLVMLF
jgi:hypothetical protein